MSESGPDLDLPTYIYGREAGPNEKVFTEEQVRALVDRIDQLEALSRSAEERAGLGEVAAMSHAKKIIALEGKLISSPVTPDPPADDKRAALWWGAALIGAAYFAIAAYGGGKMAIAWLVLFAYFGGTYGERVRVAFVSGRRKAH